MLVLPLLVCILLLNCIGQARAYEYCKKEVKICRSSHKRHIVCHKEQIEPDAEYEKHIFMTDYLRSLFLYWHNHYRNEVACGRSEGNNGMLPQAVQMRELMWDYELEYVASVHAGRCKMQHDSCRGTERFSFSGQNLAYTKSTQIRPDPIHRLWRSHFLWYRECKDVNESIILAYRKIPNVKIGHFTVLANDKIGRMGCAMTTCISFPGEKPVFYFNYVTCNYDFTNIPTYPVYVIGPATSKCEEYYGKGTGVSSNFSCLCGVSPFTYTFPKY